jgi:hypothetical protein
VYAGRVQLPKWKYWISIITRYCDARTVTEACSLYVVYFTSGRTAECRVFLQAVNGVRC